MGLTFKNTRLSNDEVMEITSIIFTKMAQEGALDDSVILAHPAVFPTWNEKWTGEKGAILMYEGALYRATSDITKDDTEEPPSTSPLWDKIGKEGDSDV